MNIKRRPIECSLPQNAPSSGTNVESDSSKSRLSRLARAKKRYQMDIGTDTRLGDFMNADPKLNEHYTRLVQEDPQGAVCKLMLHDMRRHYNEMKYISKIMPAILEWLSKQAPEIQKLVHDRIKNVMPIYRDKALVREVNVIKYPPQPKLAPGVST